VDSALAAHLAGFDAEALARDRSNLGPLLETFLVGERTREASWTPGRTLLLRLRTAMRPCPSVSA